MSGFALRCPHCSAPLAAQPNGAGLACACGKNWPVVDGIPRFVKPGHYAKRFGLQWKTFRKTQLDSHTGLTITRDRLTRMLGGWLEALADKNVLEAGCGAGRFTEILLSSGARLASVDLSAAVEANQANHGGHPALFLAQADILALPFAPASFDVVACIGVVQHTPSPEHTLAALCSMLKPGGLLVFDHYTFGYAMTPSRTALRRLILALPDGFSLPITNAVTGCLWPVHRWLWRYGGQPLWKAVRRRFLALSPVVDYHDDYGALGPELLRQWAFLDTHDTLSDRFKHLRSAEQLHATLSSLGMVDIEIARGGNGLEARARRPVAPTAPASSGRP